MLVKRVVRPGRYLACRRYKCHLTSIATQFLGDGPADVEVIIVKQHHRPLGRHTCHDVIRCEDCSTSGSVDTEGALSADAFGGPFRVGCDGDVFRPEVVEQFMCHTDFQIKIDIGHLADLVGEIIRYPAPFGQSGQAPFLRYAPALLRCSASVKRYPRRPRARVASRPAGPAPTIRMLPSAALGAMRSGCQPRCHSSLMVGF